jgi:hypothetical protein
MQTSTRLSIAISLLGIVAVLFQAPAASAEKPARDGENIRRDLLIAIYDLQNILVTPAGSPVMDHEFARARALLQDLPAESFDDLDEQLLVRLEGLRDLAVASRSMSTDAVSTPIKSTGFPSAEYPVVGFDFIISASTSMPSGSADSGSESGVCSLATWPNPEARFTFLNMSLLGEALRDTARRLCDQTVIVAGVGGNLAPVCIISDVAYLLVRGIQDNMDLCADVMLEAETKGSYERLDHVHDDLVAAESNLATEISSLQTSLVNGSNANEALLHDLDADLRTHNANLENRMSSITASLDMIARFVEDFRIEELRIRIESNLADADGKAVGDLMMPESMGGFLETVRDVTADTIQAVDNAGGDIGNAPNLLQRGDRRFARGDFAGAFDRYGLAYRAATK